MFFLYWFFRNLDIVIFIILLNLMFPVYLSLRI